MSKSPDDARPRIWADGQQKPPFQPRAFALASVIYARESLSGLLVRCAGSASGLGQTVATGRWRVPAHRLGRTGRFLPSVETTSVAILGGAEVLSRAARVALPDLDVAQKPQSIFDTPLPASTNRVEQPHPAPAQKPSQPAPQPSAIATDDPDLQAIWALMDAASAAPPRLERPAPRKAEAPVNLASPAQPNQMPELSWRREWLVDTTALLLGFGLLVVSIPWGMSRAGWAHLNGEDLRKLVVEG